MDWETGGLDRVLGGKVRGGSVGVEDEDTLFVEADFRGVPTPSQDEWCLGTVFSTINKKDRRQALLEILADVSATETAPGRW